MNSWTCGRCDSYMTWTLSFADSSSPASGESRPCGSERVSIGSRKSSPEGRILVTGGVGKLGLQGEGVSHASVVANAEECIVSLLSIGEHSLVDVIEAECFSEEALQGLYQLNHALLDLLVASASRSASEARPQVVVDLGPAFLSLRTNAREELARCPVALVDFGLRNPELWRQFESGLTILPSLPGCFPRLQAMQLGQITLTLAWTASQSNREAAAIIFGLAPECAAILSRLGVQSIPHIAESYAHCVRPRWESDTRFWRELIRVAAASDSPMQPRLPAAGVYAMQRQLADLVTLSSQPATHETAPTRSNRR